MTLAIILFWIQAAKLESQLRECQLRFLKLHVPLFWEQFSAAASDQLN